MPGLDTLLFSLAVLSSHGGGGEVAAPARYASTEHKGQFQAYNSILINSAREALADPKMSPNAKWTYSHLTVGYGRRRSDGPFQHRFRVFSQGAEMQKSLGDPTARALMRLWDIVVHRMWRDHNTSILGGAVDVYLTKEGSPGGEQMMADDRNHTFTQDPFTTTPEGKAQRVNVIYLYQVDQKIPALERMRETAHEYGHAALPPIGAFTQPEAWANGDFGERVFMRWIREGLAQGSLTSADVLGVTVPELDQYLAKNYTPLVQKGAFEGPSDRILRQKDLAAFNNWLANALWIEAILPPRVFSRALDMGSSQDPEPHGFPAGVVEGVAEFPRVELTLPSWAAGKKVWIPLGKGTVSGGNVLNRQPSGWAQVTAGAQKLVITNPKPAQS